MQNKPLVQPLTGYWQNLGPYKQFLLSNPVPFPNSQPAPEPDLDSEQLLVLGSLLAAMKGGRVPVFQTMVSWSYWAVEFLSVPHESTGSNKSEPAPSEPAPYQQLIQHHLLDQTLILILPGSPLGCRLICKAPVPDSRCESRSTPDSHTPEGSKIQETLFQC